MILPSSGPAPSLFFFLLPLSSFFVHFVLAKEKKRSEKNRIYLHQTTNRYFPHIKTETKPQTKQSNKRNISISIYFKFKNLCYACIHMTLKYVYMYAHRSCLKCVVAGPAGPNDRAPRSSKALLPHDTLIE